jgi:hypothetical protein
LLLIYLAAPETEPGVEPGRLIYNLSIQMTHDPVSKNIKLSELSEVSAVTRSLLSYPCSSLGAIALFEPSIGINHRDAMEHIRDRADRS